MTVIGFVGLPGSGKSEAADVAREAGVPVVVMGDVIREACRERGLDPADHHGEVARRLREEEGEAAIAERTLPRVREHLADSDTVVVEGIRSGVEADRFADALDDFRLVAITAPYEVRAERIAERGRDNADAESLRERDERERGFGMDEAIEAADVTVENTDSLAAFRERIGAVLGR
ncbi:MAG: AAA family ATPase [Halobacteriaceae archaeon]